MAQRRKEWAKKANAHCGDEEGGTDKAAEVALPEESLSWFQSITRCFRKCGLGEQQLTTFILFLMNVVVFAIGFLSNMSGGFKKSWAYPCAKGGGYAMDLNFALLVLPTLKSLQTTMRRVGSSREWVPIDDPINFHIVIAMFTMIAAAIHIAGHCVHAYLIRAAPTIQSDPFDLWKLTSEEKASGMTFFHQAGQISHVESLRTLRTDWAPENVGYSILSPFYLWNFVEHHLAQILSNFMRCNSHSAGRSSTFSCAVRGSLASS